MPIPPMRPFIDTVRSYLVGLQSRLTTAIADKDGGAFVVDGWSKGEGEKLQGDGITQILEGGPVFERAGCGFSHVRGPQLPPSATQHRPNWSVLPLRPWASPWCSTRATPMRPPCT